MAIVRLPQTKGEIEAAAAEIVWTARHDFYGTEIGGRDLGPTRLTEPNQLPEDKTIEEWLIHSSRLGAMEKGRLMAIMEQSLVPRSEEIRKLGTRRAVTILCRCRWRGAVSVC